MKKSLILLVLLISLNVHAQTVFGYWYGNGNVKSNRSDNNYLIEMILQPEKNYVTGIINYYFKDSYRSIKVQGNYNIATR